MVILFHFFLLTINIDGSPVGNYAAGRSFSILRRDLGLLMSSNQSQNVKRTLLIISGQLRSFDRLWPWTYASLVAPNEPCDVILSIHGNRTEITNELLQSLGPNIIAILTTEYTTPVGSIEFWLNARAIRMIQPMRYAYVIKTRTDLFHRVPIPLKILYGDHPDFLDALRKFHRQLTEKTGKSFDVGETLFAWLMTAGLVDLIPTMIMQTPSTVWSKLVPNDWNKNLRYTLRNLSQQFEATIVETNTENDRKIIQILNLALQQHKVVHNIGSTWVQFGPISHMMASIISVDEGFGQHRWYDVGFNDSDIMNSNYWRHVTESQLRLSYLKDGFNLIDIIHKPDLVQSFSVSHTFRQASQNNSYLFFIVRNERTYRDKWNLTSTTNVSYW